MQEFEPLQDEEPDIPELIPSLEERMRTLERVNQALARARAILERVNQMERGLKQRTPQPPIEMPTGTQASGPDSKE